MPTLTIIGSSASGSGFTNIANANAIDGAVATSPGLTETPVPITWACDLSVVNSAISAITATLRARYVVGPVTIASVQLLNSGSTVVGTAGETSIALTGALANHAMTFSGMTTAAAASVRYVRANLIGAEGVESAAIDGISVTAKFSRLGVDRLATSRLSESRLSMERLA